MSILKNNEGKNQIFSLTIVLIQNATPKVLNNLMEYNQASAILLVETIKNVRYVRLG